MSTHKYMYCNMAVGNEHVGVEGFMVVRLWAGRLDQPEAVCATDSVVNTELVSDALNASIGLTPHEANDLLNSWRDEYENR